MKQANEERDEFNREMGMLIKRHRKSQGLSLRDLSVSIDISIRQVIRIEAGEIGTCTFTAWKICRDLEIDINEILPSKTYVK